MAISVLDAFQSQDAYDSGTATLSYSLSIGSHRVVIIYIVGFVGSGGSITSVKINGQYATEIVSQLSNNNRIAAIYYAPEAVLPTGGSSYDIVAIRSNSSLDFSIGALTIDDATQIPEASGSTAGNGDTDTITLPITNGSFQADVAAIQNGQAGTFTWGVGQTEVFDADTGSDRGGASYQLGAGAGNEDLSFTFTESRYYTYSAVSFAVHTPVNLSISIGSFASSGINQTAKLKAFPTIGSFAASGINQTVQLVINTVIASLEAAGIDVTLIRPEKVTAIFRDAAYFAKSKTTSYFAPSRDNAAACYSKDASYAALTRDSHFTAKE